MAAMSDAPIPSTDEQEAAPSAPRLLLVDDEPGLRTAVQAYLEDEGFDVTTRWTAKKASPRPSRCFRMW